MITRPRAVLDQLREALEAVRTLSGPDVRAIGPLADRAGYASRLLRTIVPPSDLASVHALFLSASDMAGQALRMRHQRGEVADQLGGIADRNLRTADLEQS